MIAVKALIWDMISLHVLGPHSGVGQPEGLPPVEARVGRMMLGRFHLGILERKCGSDLLCAWEE